MEKEIILFCFIAVKRVFLKALFLLIKANMRTRFRGKINKEFFDL